MASAAPLASGAMAKRGGGGPRLEDVVLCDDAHVFGLGFRDVAALRCASRELRRLAGPAPSAAAVAEATRRRWAEATAGTRDVCRGDARRQWFDRTRRLSAALGHAVAVVHKYDSRSEVPPQHWSEVPTRCVKLFNDVRDRRLGHFRVCSAGLLGILSAAPPVAFVGWDERSKHLEIYNGAERRHTVAIDDLYYSGVGCVSGTDIAAYATNRRRVQIVDAYAGRKRAVINLPNNCQGSLEPRSERMFYLRPFVEMDEQASLVVVNDCLLDTRTGDVVGRQGRKQFDATAMLLDPRHAGGPRIFQGNEYGMLSVFDLRNMGVPCQYMRCGEGSITSLAKMPTLSSLLMGHGYEDKDKKLSILSARSLRTVRTFQVDANSVQVMGRWDVLLHGIDGSVRVLDIRPDDDDEEMLRLSQNVAHSST